MSSRSLGTLTLDLVAKTGGFVQGMNKAERESAKWRKKVERDMKAAGQQVKAFSKIAGASLAVFSAVAIKNTIEQERVTKQLEAVLKSTGGAAGITKDEMLGMASAMQQVTTYGDEAVIPAQSLLLTFTKIGKDVFPQALESVLDVATAMGTDLKSAATQVGKALNDPVLGITALTRSGIQFTKEQKEVIKSLSETGRVAEAQKIILQELETQFGGSARAARETLGGALKGLQNAFGDLLEGSGGSVTEATGAINDLTDALSDPQVKQAFQDITTGILNVTAAAANAIPDLVAFTRWAGESLASLTNGIAADDVARLEQDAQKIKEILDGGFLDQVERVRFFGPDGVVEFLTDQELEAKLAEINTAISSFYNRDGNKPKISPDIKPEKPVEDEKPFTDNDEPPAPKKVSDIEKQIAALKMQSETYGMSASKIGIYKLAADGATQSQLDQAAAIYKDIYAQKELAKATEETARRRAEALSLMSSLLPEQEQELRRITEQQKFLNDAVKDFPELAGQAAVALEALSKQESDLKNGESETVDEMTAFTDQAARNMQDILSSSLRSGFDDGVSGVLDSFANMLLDMAAQAAAAQIFKSLGFGSSGVGDGADVVGMASFFGGFFAEGGRPPSNKVSIVGENGPELFIPDGASGTIIPNDSFNASGARENKAQQTKINIGNMNFPNVTNAREAEIAAGAASRRIMGTINGAQRFG